MSATLRLVHSLDRDWPPRRRAQLHGRIDTMLAFTKAVWDRDGIEACLKAAADHWQRISADFPDSWEDVAVSAGWL